MFDIIISEYKYLLVLLIVLYLAFVRYARFKYLRTIRQKYPDPNIVLQDLDIAEEIFANILLREFPLTIQKALEFGLFKTYAVPSISTLLNATAEFRHHCPRRVEDTEFLLREIVEPFGRVQKQLKKNPNTPQEDIDFQFERADLAIERMNEIHGNYNISNKDHIYTLSLFITEPYHWVNRFEWRTMDIREYNAIFHVAYSVGLKMKIKHLPKTIEEMTSFQKAYAEKHVSYSPNNWKIGEPTLRFLLSQFPSIFQEPLYQLTVKVLFFFLDEKETHVFQLPPENKDISLLLTCFFHVRAFIVRYFCLPRTDWIVQTPFYPNDQGYYVPEYSTVYPNGYKIEELGPEKFMPKKCPF